MNAVIFDMDGLMFDTERIYVEAWDYAGERMGVGKAGYMNLRTLGMNASLSRKEWQKEFGDRYDERKLRDYTKEFLEDYYERNGLPVKKGLYRLLDYLKEREVKLAVASSSARSEIEGHLQRAGISEFFRVVIGGDMIRHSKPEPDIYQRACEELGEAPGDCFALEDSKNGLLAAYRAGCVPLMVPDLWEPDKEIQGILAGKFKDLDEVRGFFVHNLQENE